MAKVKWRKKADNDAQEALKEAEKVSKDKLKKWLLKVANKAEGKRVDKLGTLEERNAAIVDAAWQALDDETLPNKGGYCLMTTRMIVERALGLGDGGFYRTYLEGHPKAAPDVPRSWWARDAHKILRDTHRYGVPVEERMAGDLVFNYAVAPSEIYKGFDIGHVGILIDTNTVLENGGANRGIAQFGAIHLTRLKRWLEVHQVIRLGDPKLAQERHLKVEVL